MQGDFKKGKEMKLGQYTVYDDEFRFKYLVRKIMKKTAIVTCISVYKGSQKATTHYRYPLDLLAQQIKNAEYLEFV